MVEYIDKEFEFSKERGYEGPGYYFWDEGQVNVFGPYKTKEEAESENHRYARDILGIGDE